MSFDSYVNYFYDGMVSFIDYLKDAAFFIDEPKRVDEQMKAVETEFRDSMSNRLEKGYVLRDRLTLCGVEKQSKVS